MIVYYGETATTRQAKSYKKHTDDFSRTPSNMVDHPLRNPENMKPFNGPITLSQGSHAIPWSLRIPKDVMPTTKILAKNKKDVGELWHT